MSSLSGSNVCRLMVRWTNVDVDGNCLGRKTGRFIPSRSFDLEVRFISQAISFYSCCEGVSLSLSSAKSSCRDAIRD